MHLPSLSGLLALLALASCLTLGGCDDSRAICGEAVECASFCEQLGLPIEGAACADGECTCREPVVDAEDDLVPDAATDMPSTGTSSDAQTADSSDDDGVANDTAAAADSTSPDASDTSDTRAVDLDDAVVDAAPLRCPPDMVDRGAFCIDRYEAPNFEGALPLVMYSFDEAEAWCVARGKRLCFDDEWTTTCAGAAETAYPYGDAHEPGVCNDEEIWRVYSQSLLSQWPLGLPTSQIDALSALFQTARAIGSNAAASADHVESLYQAEPSGSNLGCANEHAVYDLTGNVEEWTRRRDGGQPDFHGNLKGRYWAETRTCQSNLVTHGDGFRFYEIGFRCCADPGE